MYEGKSVQLTAKDGVKLSAHLFSNHISKPNLIIVASAAGVPQYYYKKFAQFASGSFDFDVLTFDYRGIAGSLNHPIKKDQSLMSEWGSHDLNAAIRWGNTKYDKIFLIGHSVAGQVFPKAEYADSVTAAYFVCTATASKKFWNGWPAFVVNLFWYVAIPLLSVIYGYLPSWVLGGGENLPLPAVKEWRKWGLHPQGVLQGKAEVTRQFARLHMPIHFLNVEDDKILAPVSAAHELMHYYSNAVTTFQFIRPKDLKIKKIGHFGFFSSGNKDKLWSMPIMYFTQYVRSLEELSLADTDR